jgi:hypothetical protein
MRSFNSFVGMMRFPVKIIMPQCSDAMSPGTKARILTPFL